MGIHTSTAMAKSLSGKEMGVSMDEMMAERVDPSFRDYCAHMLIPLNQCRRKEWYLPWKCGPERHAYEKCEFDEYAVQSCHIKLPSSHLHLCSRYMARMKSNVESQERQRKAMETAAAAQ